ncbi:MAG: GNAT family N-acetyltransferase [Acidimicrobiia bacterium]|nr:GNAT family N-acetyltransferase [Acidimicrobiia bacterium]
MATNGEVGLRAVTEADLPWLAAIAADPEASGEHNWGGQPVDPSDVEEELRARFRDDRLLGFDRGSMIVELDGRTPIGDVSWRAEQWGPSAASRCLAFGITLLPSYRGKGHGTEAQRQLITYLFRTTDVHRIQSDTAADNPAERRALEKLGMHPEGVVRQAEYRAGRYHDHILFSVLRPEWHDARSWGRH